MQSKTFTDFDAFADSVRDVDAEMMFQNAKRRSGIIHHVHMSHLHVQLGRLGSGNIVEGQSWSNGYLIYLPVTGNCEYLVNGTVVKKGAFAILEPACDFCVATRSEHDWCSIFVPADRFADSSEKRSSRIENGRCRVSQAKHQAARQFGRLVDQIMTTAAKHPKFENSPAATHAEADLLKVASAVVGGPVEYQHHQEGRPLIPRHEIVRRCKQLLEERDAQPIHVDELAAAADVSEWTLRRAFKECYGISPVRYLQLRQLHQVHRVLKASAPEETNVTDVLFAHGVSELGRFATRYGAMFGELPSETLRAKRR